MVNNKIVSDHKTPCLKCYRLPTERSYLAIRRVICEIINFRLISVKCSVKRQDISSCVELQRSDIRLVLTPTYDTYIQYNIG